MKKVYSINKDYIGTRLDRWIRKNIINLPQSLIEKSIRKGKIRVNERKVKSLYKLQLNDQIILRNFNYLPNKKNQKKYIYKVSKSDLNDLSKIFIENNENFAVINKPAGIPVQPGTKSKKNILDILKKTKQFEGYNPFTVHRIDKETTGVLVVAKNRKYAQLFTTLFRIRKINKVYLCIALGAFKKTKGVFEDTLFHYEGKKKINTKAITNYEVIDMNNNFTLLRLNPSTGRKHQLRKQLLIHGHPVLGDSKYRTSFKDKNIKEHLMLHAHQINFTINDIKYKFIAELPLEFSSTLKEKYLKIY